MKRLTLVAIPALALFAVTLPVSAQPKPGAPDLPVTQITLFSSGVGYFQREGQVDGHARIDLQFPMTDINDLLKSLILQDLGGGQITAVNYDSHDPVEKTLKSFAVNLTGNPTFAQLLDQARGEIGSLLVIPAAIVAGGRFSTRKVEKKAEEPLI